MSDEYILDYIILEAGPGVDLDKPGMAEELADLAGRQVMAQYKGQRPRAVMLEPIEWTITNDWRVVEANQPAHDCPTCRAGNDGAIAYLREHPDRRLALGNLRYREVW